MKIILAILLIISINNSCNTKKNILIDVKNVTKIEIINKTNKNYIVNSTSFSDKKNIGLLINQINNLKLLDTEVNTKSNFGYFDISIMLTDGSVMGFDVLETEYSGFVVVNIQNSERYRNDRLHDLIIVLFREYPGGSGSIIGFDPRDPGIGIVNEDGTTGRPPQVGLGHELGHAKDGINGKVQPHLSVVL